MDSVIVQCPACFEWVELTIDPGEADGAEWVTDCEVCCRPMRVRLQHTADGWAVAEVVGE